MLFLDVDGVLALKGSAPGGYADLLAEVFQLHRVVLVVADGPVRE